MLSEINSSLNQYYLKSPSYFRNNKIKVQKDNNSAQINNQYYSYSKNLIPNENNNNKNRGKKITSAKHMEISDNALGKNFTFKSDDIYTPKPQNQKMSTIKNSKLNQRPKSATKTKININYNFLNSNNKKSLPINLNIIEDDDYDINSNMEKFQNLLNIIEKKGFQKYQDEINEKKIIISKLENSIAILKNKISLSKNNIYNRCHKETKDKIKYEKMLSVGSRFKNVGKSTYSFKNEINIMRNKIAFLNEETLQIKNITFQEQNDIDAINDEIKKGNKAISDRQKQIENILAAIQLLKKHIISVNQKIGGIKNIKYNYIDKLNIIENNINNI